MLTICYPSRALPTARALMAQGLELTRSSQASINWGKRYADTELNSDVSNVTNKRVMRELFAQNDVPMPKLVPDYQRAFDEGKVLVGRPDKHTKGRGFWKCRNMQEVTQAMRGKTFRNGKRKAPATHFMEFVDAPREYRAHIFRGKSIRISEKAFGLTGETARGDYITVKPQHEISHVRNAAKKAVEAVGLDFGAVDILANDTECWVLEVNSAPSLGGSLPRLYAQKFNEWYEEQRGER